MESTDENAVTESSSSVTAFTNKMLVVLMSHFKTGKVPCKYTYITYFFYSHRGFQPIYRPDRPLIVNI